MLPVEREGVSGLMGLARSRTAAQIIALEDLSITWWVRLTNWSEFALLPLTYG